MTKFVERLFAGALLGLGLGFAVLVLGILVNAILGDWGRELCQRTIGLLNWPMWELIKIDEHHHWGLLYEKPVSTLLALAVYWMLVGEVCWWAIVIFRHFHPKRDRPGAGSFPIGPSK